VPGVPNYLIAIKCQIPRVAYARLTPDTRHPIFDCARPPTDSLILKRTEIPEGIQPITLRKEVIQPQVLLQLPCYDFTPITSHTLGACPLAVSTATSSTTSFHDVTGGVYKARERIHRGMLIRDY
jgi:hypothetical protein